MDDRVTRLRRAHRYDEAIELIEETLDGAVAEVELGRIALQRRRHAVADDHLQRAVALDPTNELARAWQVALLSSRRRYAEARKLADVILAELPDAHLTRIARGRVSVDETGDNSSLLSEVEDVLDRDPNHLEALEWRISALKHLARYAESDEAAREARRRYPYAPELACARGSALAAAGRSDEALRCFELALNLQSDYIYAHEKKTSHLCKMGRYDEALSYIENVIEQHRDVGLLYSTWGMALHGIENHADALDKFEHSVTLDPLDEGSHAMRVAILQLLGRTDQVVKAIEEGLGQLPDSIGLLIQKAASLWIKDDPTTALDLLEEASTKDPHDPHLTVFRISLLRFRGRFDDAEEVARTGIKNRSRDADLVNELGWIYADQDRDEEALALFVQAANLAPDSTEFAADESRALRWLHRHTEAHRALDEAIERLPQRAELLEQKALTHEATGADDEA
ncbi:tetratricopeptide repeat protein, partial [Umezawaea endophytica]